MCEWCGIWHVEFDDEDEEVAEAKFWPIEGTYACTEVAGPDTVACKRIARFDRYARLEAVSWRRQGAGTRNGNCTIAPSALGRSKVYGIHPATRKFQRLEAEEACTLRGW